MARRRIISQDLISDENYNSLSIEAQLLFVRILAVSDDCGIVPATPYTLAVLTNPPPSIRDRIETYLEEITSGGLGCLFEYNGKTFFAFKRESFDTLQKYLIHKRTRSEFLKLSEDAVFELISPFQESPGISGKLKANVHRSIESIKSKDESIKQGGVGGIDRERSEPGVAEEILAAYPRQAALQQGLHAIEEQLQTHDAKFLLERTQAFAAAMSAMPKRYIALPGRWFVEQRFLEDPAEWASTEAPTNGWITREQLLQMSQKDSRIEKKLECWEFNHELVYRHPTADPPPAGYRNLYSPPSTHAPPENGTTHNGAPPTPDE